MNTRHGQAGLKMSGFTSSIPTIGKTITRVMSLLMFSKTHCGMRTANDRQPGSQDFSRSLLYGAIGHSFCDQANVGCGGSRQIQSRREDGIGPPWVVS